MALNAAIHSALQSLAVLKGIVLRRVPSRWFAGDPTTVSAAAAAAVETMLVWCRPGKRRGSHPPHSLMAC